MSYLDGLNEAQCRAVLETEGPISVLAGAGAGKTRVLTSRIYHLIRSGVSPKHILAVTFTNKAAREMSTRILDLLGEDPVKADHKHHRQEDLPFITTFHGLGRNLLERYGNVLGLPRFFSIYDRTDSEKIIAAALKVLDISVKELPPRVVLSRISRAKSEGLDLETFASRYGQTSFGTRITIEVWRSYDHTLHQEKALDFDDLIALPVRLLEKYATIRTEARELWEYLHIDEYQDTNELQGRLIRMLGEIHKNIFVVGDIDQTIYTWRGATIDNLLSFEKQYPKAKTIVLERNYRATKNLVAAANAIIEKNKNRKEKHSTTENETGAPIIVHVALNAEDEALWIAHTIRMRIREGISPEEIAVLFRTNFQSRALEEGLLHAGVPYKLLGTRFFERKEVRDVLAWLRLAIDPSRQADKIRAAGAPPRGIGRVTLAKLAVGARDSLRRAEHEKIKLFERIVEELVQATTRLTPSELIKLTIEKSGIRRALVEEGSDEDRERFENVEELATVATRYDGMPGREGLAAFLAEAALASDQDELDRGEKSGVRLMTVHAAKGLEFETVFVTGMEEGLFPHESISDEDRDDEEERRLFYVAVTRAKRLLFLSCARVRKIYGSDYFTEPSSFLADLDSALTVYDESNAAAIVKI